jgi:hypothetical protein
MVAEIKDEARL